MTDSHTTHAQNSGSPITYLDPSSIETSQLHIERKTVGQARAGHIGAGQSALFLSRSEALETTQSAIGVSASRSGSARNSAIGVSIGGNLELKNVFAWWVAGGNVQADRVLSLAIIGGNVQGNVRALMSTRTALALGVALGMSSLLARLVGWMFRH